MLMNEFTAGGAAFQLFVVHSFHDCAERKIECVSTSGVRARDLLKGVACMTEVPQQAID
jgi:hypothetical protein